jgi:hypothetical protein
MRRSLSNRDVLAAKFEVADFEGEWLRSLGRPELRGSWIIWGGSGSGKTTFTLMLCKYLTGFTRVAYNSLEQGLSLSLQIAWKRVGMEEAGSRIMLLRKEPLGELRKRLRKHKSPKVIVIDSVQYLVGFRLADYVQLLREFPSKLFIWIAHEDQGHPDGKLAKQIRYDADIKMHIEGFKAQVVTRYERAEYSEGGKDYVIWEEGAKAYWIDKF